MFGIGNTHQRNKSKDDIRHDMFMLQYEAKDKLESLAISCKQCRDLGVVAVAYISIDDPDTPYVEYNRCNCGVEVHPRLVSFMQTKVK